MAALFFGSNNLSRMHQAIKSNGGSVSYEQDAIQPVFWGRHFGCGWLWWGGGG